MQRPSPLSGLPTELQVVEQADALVAEWSLTPPIRLEVVAGICGVARVERVPLPHAACLVPTRNGSVIKLRNSDSVERQNFSGFHEVGHTFMPGYQLSIQLRCDPGRNSGFKKLEHLCDIAASELLLPRRLFTTDLRDAALDFRTVDELGARYQASVEATARRIVALWPRPAFLVSLEVCNKPRDTPGAEPRLRAKSYVPAGTAWPAISPFKSLDADDPVQQVLLDGHFEGRSPLAGLTDGRRPYRVHARYSPWLDKRTGELRRRVMCLVTPMLFSRLQHA
jgi:Zn-dependent peptidase ImmA (M78 family)